MATAWPQVVLFGDSLFQMSTDLLDGFAFQAALQSQCTRRFDVVNRGLSGYNTRMALKVLPTIFPPEGVKGIEMKYLFVLFGANDAAVNEQHVPLEEYKANLRAILTHANITAHRPQIFLVTPPPLDEIQMEQTDLVTFGNAAVTRHARTSASYSAAARELGAELVAQGAITAVVDLHKGLMDRAVDMTPGFKDRAGGDDGHPPLLGDPQSGGGYLEHLLTDGLHMTGESYRIFYDLVKPHIVDEEPFEGFVLPDWQGRGSQK